MSHLLYILNLSNVNKAKIFSTDFQNYSNTKFHKNPAIGIWGQADGQTGRET
jgi:ABC-type phosphate transport system substrate-binding protein